MRPVVIVGAGIAGLTLALVLHSRGIAARVFESAMTIEPLGVGLNIQPYACRILRALGLLRRIAEQAVTPREMLFFNRFGQKIHAVPLGEFGGHDCPQLSVHRATLQSTLLQAARERLGADFLTTGHTFVSLTQSGADLAAVFLDRRSGHRRVSLNCDALIGADGVHSSVYRTLFPDGPALTHQQVHMWRGVTAAPQFLGGCRMIRVGLPAYGKLVAYPIRDGVTPQGHQLINWVAEVATDRLAGMTDDEMTDNHSFIRFYARQRFDWLDLPALLAGARGPVLSLPMMDRDPLPHWRVGRVTLIGDAAHPMLPVGSNGAGQAIVDADSLGRHMATAPTVEEAMRRYEAERRPVTTDIVLGDRADLPDQIIKLVDDRTGGRPFKNIRDVISDDEARRLASPRYHAATEHAGMGADTDGTVGRGEVL